MKDIKIPFRSSSEFLIEKNKKTKVFSSYEFELYRKLRKRGQTIVQSGLDIEEFVKELISKLLFGNLEDSDFIVGVLLDSSACTFMVKRKILASCLAHFDILQPDERRKMDECLSRVIKYRNAFAHGKINTNKPFYIEYFEGDKQKKELTEEYWDTLVEHLKNTFKLLEKIEEAINKKS